MYGVSKKRIIIMVKQVGNNGKLYELYTQNVDTLKINNGRILSNRYM
jgi:NAD-dependent SIR2 family protein deacetylase